MVVVVCVFPPKVTKQFPAIPGVWRHCPKYLMVALAAEDDVHATVRDPNDAAQFEPTVEHGVCVAPRRWPSSALPSLGYDGIAPNAPW